MKEYLSDDLHIEECDSIKEAKQMGESLASFDYHVVLAKRKIFLVFHAVWVNCHFCNIEKKTDSYIISI
jgi:hypothetical protein